MLQNQNNIYILFVNLFSLQIHDIVHSRILILLTNIHLNLIIYLLKLAAYLEKKTQTRSHIENRSYNNNNPQKQGMLGSEMTIKINSSHRILKTSFVSQQFRKPYSLLAPSSK